jgi:hypothetical protein
MLLLIAKHPIDLILSFTFLYNSKETPTNHFINQKRNKLFSNPQLSLVMTNIFLDMEAMDFPRKAKRWIENHGFLFFFFWFFCLSLRHMKVAKFLETWLHGPTSLSSSRYKERVVKKKP